MTAGAARIVKTALLTSFVAEFDASLTRTSACAVGVFGTVHPKLPVDAEVLATTVLQLVPLFVEYSIWTLAMLVDDQLMF